MRREDSWRVWLAADAFGIKLPPMLGMYTFEFEPFYKINTPPEGTEERWGYIPADDLAQARYRHSAEFRRNKRRLDKARAAVEASTPKASAAAARRARHQGV